MAPVTEFAALRLKPSITPDNEEFKKLWSSAIERTNAESGTKFQLWQDTAIPEHIYLIGGWSSPAEQAKSLKSGVEIIKSLDPYQTLRFARHIEVDVNEIPRDSPTLSVETFSVAEGDEELFRTKAKEAEKTVSGLKGATSPCGGFDVRPESREKFAAEFKAAEEAAGFKQGAGEQTQEKAEEAEEKKEGLKQVIKIKTWVSFTGWKDTQEHLDSAKEMTKGYEEPSKKVQLTPNVFDTVHMKKILE